MGYITLQAGTDTNNIIGNNYRVNRQWAVDFSVFSGATIDSYLDFDFDADGGGYRLRTTYGGASDTNDGTALSETPSQLTSDQYVSQSDTGISAPSGAQIVKIMSSFDTGDGGSGTSRGTAITLGNAGSDAMVCLDGGMTTAVFATTTLLRTFAVTPEGLPGAGNLLCTLCLHHGDSSETLTVREGGTYGAVDGNIVNSASMNGSAGAESFSFTLTRPTAATQLKVCVEGSEGVNVFGFTLIMRAA